MGAAFEARHPFDCPRCGRLIAVGEAIARHNGGMWECASHGDPRPDLATFEFNDLRLVGWMLDCYPPGMFVPGECMWVEDGTTPTWLRGDGWRFAPGRDVALAMEPLGDGRERVFAYVVGGCLVDNYITGEPRG
jgi:hypothetical protein